MSHRSDEDSVRDMLEAAKRAMDYCVGLDYSQFLQDGKTQDAVVRNIEILGEAANSVSVASRLKYPAIPWGSVTGMRNRLIHDYFGVNFDIVWEVVIDDLPTLAEELNRMLLDNAKNESE